MPLSCRRAQEIVCAFRFDEVTWRELRERDRTERKLQMLCCGAGAVVKTSKLLTRFFAHERTGVCATAEESSYHLLAKNTIARALQVCGAAVLTERRSGPDDPDDWTADVYAEVGDRRIAFEIQWSTQTEEETRRRTERY